MSDQSTSKGWYGWLDDRFDLSPLVDFMRHKEVPLGTHPIVWYFLGGATLFFFAIQIISGILLLMSTKVPFGWLVRSVHCWSAHLMIISLVVHMFSTMMLKAYRRPRELTWVTGCVLFGMAMAFGFSGYLLPWNELAFFATSVGTDSVKEIPLIGDWLLQVMRGGPEVTINTLNRFFALHVSILPFAVFAVIGGHLLFIQRQGMAPPLGLEKAARGMSCCLTVLVGLAVFLPYGPGIPGFEWELGDKANILAPAYPGIKPEWYFLWVYQLLKEFPPHLLF